MSEYAKSIISQLLEKDPSHRLGTPQQSQWEDLMPGAFYVKEHEFFTEPREWEEEGHEGIDWDNLLLEKANFVPNLEDELDTSYFDDRRDRYSYDLSEPSGEEDESELNKSASLMSPVPPSEAAAYDVPTVNVTAADEADMVRAKSKEAIVRPDTADKAESESDNIVNMESSSTREGTPNIDSPVPDIRLLPPSPSQTPKSAERAEKLLERRRKHREDRKVAADQELLSPDTSAAASAVMSPAGSPSMTLKVPSEGSSEAASTCPLGCVGCKTVTVEYDEQTGFGFSMHAASGSKNKALRHRVMNVTKGGTADKAGMEPGMAIIQVNGHDITSFSHQKVVRFIKQHRGKPTSFHLVDLTVEEKKNKSPKSPHTLRRLTNSLTNSLRRKKKKNKEEEAAGKNRDSKGDRESGTEQKFLDWIPGFSRNNSVKSPRCVSPEEQRQDEGDKKDEKKSLSRSNSDLGKKEKKGW